MSAKKTAGRRRSSAATSAADSKRQRELLIQPRSYDSRELSLRICAPEERIENGEVIPVLVFGAMNSDPRRFDCTPGVFLLVHGAQLIGAAADGLDQLTEHKFRVYFDGEDQNRKIACGMDTVSSKATMGGWEPVDRKEATSLILEWQRDSNSCRATQVPLGLRWEDVLRTIDQVEAMIKKEGRNPGRQDTFLDGKLRYKDMDVDYLELSFVGTGDHAGESVRRGGYSSGARMPNNAGVSGGYNSHGGSGAGGREVGLT